MNARKTLRTSHALAALAGVVLGSSGVGFPPPMQCQRTASATDVVINEIHYHPPSDLEMEEFIELWNWGATAVSLAGWSFSNGVQFSFAAGTTLGPNQYIVVAKDPATLAPLAPGATIVGPWVGGLQNDGERIRLVNPLDQTVEEVRYNDAPPWPTTPDGRGTSLERISPSARSDDPGNWLTVSASVATGMTPGQQNSAYRTNVPPFVFSIAQTPPCPRPPEATTISAYVRDTDGVASANLLYQTLRSSSQSGIFTLPMTLRGGSAQVGLWTAQIPAQPDRTVVRFRVEAADTLGATRMSPDPTEARDTYSYFQYADDVASSIPVVFTYQFGPEVPQDSFRGNVALIIRPPDSAGWEIRDHIVRSNRDNGHNIFFLDHHDWDGMSSINIIFDEKPRYALSEYLTFEVHRALGSLSEKSGHYRFFRNDNREGYKLMFEQPNQTFLGRNGLDNDGNLYKIRYDAPPEKKTNLSLGNQDIVDLQSALGSLSGAALTDYLFQNIAVDQVINYYVGCQITSDWDGYFNNHFLYHDFVVTGAWYKIPWDKDKTWGDNDAFGRHPAPGGGYLYPVYDMPILFGARGTPRSGLDSDTWWRPPGWLSGPFLADPAVQRRYVRRLEQAVTREFTTSRWLPIINALEQRLEPEVIERATILGHSVSADLALFHNDIESLRQQVINRGAWLRGAVNPLTYPCVTEVLPSSGSVSTVPPSEIVVSFTEPISTATVSANTFLLVRSGGDGVFGQPNDVAIAASSPPALVAFDRARFPLDGVNLPPDRYQISLLGTGMWNIRDTVGNQLDGEYLGSLPSGDGVAGGNFHSEFEIAASPSAQSRPSWSLYP